MLSIIDTWPDYYDDMDEGLGTTYERFILHNYFEKLAQRYQVESVLEIPSFGMTGVSLINSLWWAEKGTPVTVVDDNTQRISLAKKVWTSIPLKAQFEHVSNFSNLPFKEKAFDLTWNFAALWFIKELPDFIEEIKRVTRKVVFVCVPNTNGLGFIYRTKFNKEDIQDFYLENVYKDKFVPLFENAGLELVESGYLDIPPWPDIAMKKEEMLKKIGLGFFVKKNRSNNNNDPLCIVDYFSGKNKNMEKEILKYSFLEKAPSPIKQLWGHHRWFIFKT